MHIPPIWIKVSGSETDARGRSMSLSAWGWGDDEAGARSTGANRLERLLARIRRGEPFPDRYGYGAGVRPMREEILDTKADAESGETFAIITRNSYGAAVLNTSRMLFLDVDFQPVRGLQRLLRSRGGANGEHAVGERLRSALQTDGHATFNVYRTASGFRALAIDRLFDPDAVDVQQLMQITGTDPAFAQLCRAQNCFRARLTPKPWRCDVPNPPGEYPRRDASARSEFEQWLRRYDDASSRYATCQFVETIGSGAPLDSLRDLIDLHDAATRACESLPLA